MRKRQYQVGSERGVERWQLLKHLLPESSISAKGGQKRAQTVPVARIFFGFSSGVPDGRICQSVFLRGAFAGGV
jgi:hypothetical protein